MKIFVYKWAIFHGSKWANNEIYKSHLVTLTTAHVIMPI